MSKETANLTVSVTEPIYIDGIGDAIAKIDTGNDGHNVIHGAHLVFSNGNVTFKTINGNFITKKVVDNITVHIGGGHQQDRPVVELDFQIRNKVYKKALFSIADRSKNDVAVLLSKPFLEKAGAVVSLTEALNASSQIIFASDKISLVDGSKHINAFTASGKTKTATINGRVVCYMTCFAPTSEITGAKWSQSVSTPTSPFGFFSHALKAAAGSTKYPDVPNIAHELPGYIDNCVDIVMDKLTQGISAQYRLRTSTSFDTSSTVITPALVRQVRGVRSSTSLPKEFADRLTAAIKKHNLNIKDSGIQEKRKYSEILSPFKIQPTDIITVALNKINAAKLMPAMYSDSGELIHNTDTRKRAWLDILINIFEKHKDLSAVWDTYPSIKDVTSNSYRAHIFKTVPTEELHDDWDIVVDDNLSTGGTMQQISTSTGGQNILYIFMFERPYAFINKKNK